MTDLILQTLGFIAAVVIFWRAESILNLMAPGFRLLVRLAFWLLVVGAAAFAVRIWQGYTPPAGAALAFTGMALLLISERRVRAILRIPTPVKHDRRIDP